MKRLRIAIAGDEVGSSARFAATHGFTSARWSNFERNYNVSIDAATQLCQRIPGLTLDWIYFGKSDGLTMEMGRRLGVSSPVSERRRSR